MFERKEEITKRATKIRVSLLVQLLANQRAQ